MDPGPGSEESRVQKAKGAIFLILIFNLLKNMNKHMLFVTSSCKKTASLWSFAFLCNHFQSVSCHFATSHVLPLTVCFVSHIACCSFASFKDHLGFFFAVFMCLSFCILFLNIPVAHFA